MCRDGALLCVSHPPTVRGLQVCQKTDRVVSRCVVGTCATDTRGYMPSTCSTQRTKMSHKSMFVPSRCVRINTACHNTALMKTNCAPASQCSESHARSQKCTGDSHITAQFLTRKWVCSHLNGTACSHRPKTSTKTKCTLHLQCQERPAQQGSAALRHHKTTPRSSAEHTSCNND